MKKLVSVILTAALLFGFAACSPVSKDSIKPAIYKAEDDLFPRLYLREDGEFSFLITPASSSNAKGTYSVADGILKLEGSDGKVYCFDIKKDALVFNGELSDEFVKAHENDPEIVDGTKFELWHQSLTHPSTDAQTNKS
ncbi:MAG: hypothetical protein IJD49_08830 [Clostridia bacterium]|nr:hypothetical protein [Clostridia bacterium]